MKKILFSIVSAGMLLAGMTSCTEDFKDMNADRYGVTKDQMQRDGYALSSSMTYIQGWVIPVDVNTNQFVECLLGGSYGGYLADSNSGFNGHNFAQYDPAENWNWVPFTDIIPKMFIGINGVKAVTDDPVALAVANVTKVYGMLRVTDIYGPIPYSKVGEDGKISTPYDSQEDVYNTMFDELTEAANVLSEHRQQNFSANADLIYGGVVENWIKFTNSLKLRMALRISGVAPAKARQMAEEAVAAGVMESNADNAALTPSGKNPFEVICWEYNNGDSHISADILSYMNGYNDPRRAAMFTQSTFTAEDVENGFIGLRNGVQIPSGGTEKLYANMKVSDNDKVQWMNAAEVCFLRAEGALKGWNMGGTAQQFYEQGVRLSFEQWGVNGADAYLADATSTPALHRDPVNAVFNYSGTAPTITISWDDAATDAEKLERIITQKWIANFPLGQEAWAEYRRTGYPRLMPVMVNNSNGVVSDSRMARRLRYPQTERSENTDNYQAAVVMLGGADTMGDRKSVV